MGSSIKPSLEITQGEIGRGEFPLCSSCRTWNSDVLRPDCGYVASRSDEHCRYPSNSG